MTRNLLELFGLRKRIDPVAAGAGLNLLYDRQTAAVIARVLDSHSCCVDVGCHKGQILDLMLARAPEGRHYAFEPIPHMCMRLRGKYRSLPNVEIHELALSDAPGATTFQHVVTNPGYSGLLRRRYDRPDEEVVEIPVRMARLDDIVPADVAVTLIKIDVEGAELQVLRGGLETLRRSRPCVIFEHGQGGDAYGTRPEQVYDLFRDCGLRISLMEGWLASPATNALSREQFVQEYDLARNYYFMAHV